MDEGIEGREGRSKMGAGRKMACFVFRSAVSAMSGMIIVSHFACGRGGATCRSLRG